MGSATSMLPATISLCFKLGEVLVRTRFLSGLGHKETDSVRRESNHSL